MIIITDSDRTRFWSKVNLGSYKECWDWNASLQTAGYGQISIDGTQRSAHRISYLITYGTIPKGLCVLHRCDNKKCVNPQHLFLGTHKDNAIDAARKGRLSNRGETHPSARLTSADVLAIRSLWRSGKVTQKQIADQFRVTEDHVGDIVRRRYWSHLS